MKRKIRIYLLALLPLLAGVEGSAQEDHKISSGTDTTLQFRAVAELGFLGVLAHHIQLGENGTYFNYVKDGGQNVLFPFTRLSLEVTWKQKNTLILLYQPLRIESQSLLRSDAVFNGTTFPAATGIKLLYNFPFYRVSYLRELTSGNPDFTFAIGGSLQIRNATITFESTDGTAYTDSRDIGPVPAFKVRSKLRLNKTFYTEFEADGMYAPVSYLNGSDNEVVGAILDASLRLGTAVNDFSDMMVNVRYLGGGATGTSTGDVFPGDGYVRNWLGFLTVSAGFVLSF